MRFRNIFKKRNKLDTERQMKVDSKCMLNSNFPTLTKAKCSRRMWTT